MNKLKSLVAATTLTFALVIPVAGQTPTCKPGETQTPPCPPASVMSEEPAAVLGETQTQPEVQSGEMVSSLVELALQVLFLA